MSDNKSAVKSAVRAPTQRIGKIVIYHETINWETGEITPDTLVCFWERTSQAWRFTVGEAIVPKVLRLCAWLADIANEKSNAWGGDYCDMLSNAKNEAVQEDWKRRRDEK